MNKLECLSKLNKEQQKLLLNKWKRDEVIETKLSIISLAYTDTLSHNDLYDLYELYDILSEIS